jgi:hypothetical protein
MFAASKSGRAVTAKDPYFPYVPLLLETTSTNGQQNNTFLDSSTNNFTITRNGTATQGSVTPYWPNGYWGNYFGGSADFINGTSASLAFGTGNFTLEAWIYVNALAATNGVVSTLPVTGGPGVGLNVLTSGVLRASIGNSGAASDFNSSSTISIGTWYHVAFVRSGSSVNVYINGTSVASGTNSSSIPTTDFIVGRSYTNLAAGYCNGYISNVRITNTAVYTGAFTPSTTPLTAVSGTILLTSQSNRFRDNSASPLTISTGGTPQVQAFQPFSPAASYTAAAYGGSGYFGGSSYLTAPDNAVFDFGSGDFTIEAWIWPTSTSTTEQEIFGKRATSAVFAPILFGVKASGSTFRSYYVGSLNGSSWGINGGFGSGTAVIPLNDWTHIALTRSGTTFTSYVNGVSDLVVTGISSALMTNSTAISIAASAADGSNALLGYLSNLRIIKGTAVYTGAFTPPTLAPITTAGSTSAASYSSTTNVNTSFTAASTSLLANFTNAGIYDAAVQNNAITVGSAQASTTITPKWGVTSMKFNGSTDYLTMPSNPAFAFGTGNFTIEAWVYITSSAAEKNIVSTRGAAGSANAWSLSINTSNGISFYSNTFILNTSSNISLSTWTYVAVTREGTGASQTKLYINGSNVASAASAENFTSQLMAVGASNDGSQAFFNGYLQDVRITKGYARTITTPTAAFPTR